MIIRKAEISDIKNIMLMYNSCVSGMIENNIDQWDSTYPNSKIISLDIQKKTYYVVEDNKSIIGGINIDQIQDPTYLDIKWEDSSDNFLVVHRLAVKKEYWNKNIGKKLMLHAEKLVEKLNLKSIRLDTYGGNPIAMKFYIKLGYVKKGFIFLKPGKNEYYCFEKIIKK